MVHRIEVEVALEGLCPLAVVEPRRPAVLIWGLRSHQVPTPGSSDLGGVSMGVLPPVEVEAGRIVCGLDRYYRPEAVRVPQGEMQRNLSPKRGAHKDRGFELQCVAEGGDEGDVVVGGELVLLLPPLRVLRRVGLAVAGKIIGDYAVVLGDVLIFEQVPPLVVVAASGVLANQRLTRAILQKEDFALLAHDLDGHVATRNW